jgi:NADPH-dependent 2,4-dienoyl-CoA reductase/sulfur reductase-like enzyme
MPEFASVDPATDVAIIGAGPAGMAAAIEARRHGLAVTVLDDQPAIGGQILRGVTGTRRVHYETWGAPLASAFQQSGARHVRGASVWARDGKTLVYGVEGQTCRLQAKAVILATGSMERPVVLPGHTLPGVVTVGALQSLLKGSAAVPSGRYVLAGSGPLLLLTALQLTEAGAPPLAIIDTTPRGRWRTSLRKAPGLVGDPALALSGLKLLARIRMAKIPVFRHATDLRVLGTDRAEGLAFRTEGHEHRLEAGMVALHDGVVPNDQLAVSFGCASRWNADAQAYAMVTTAEVRASVGGIWIAGDAAAISGGYLATVTGRLAALDVARELAILTAEAHAEAAAPVLAERSRRLAARRFVDALYAPTLSAAKADGTALLCRCEEVPVSRVRAVIAEGATGTRQVKAATRCGMGPCQGRQCTLSLVSVLAEELGAAVTDFSRPSLRTPGRPITVAELAASHSGQGHTGSDA